MFSSVYCEEVSADRKKRAVFSGLWSLSGFFFFSSPWPAFSTMNCVVNQGSLWLFWRTFDNLCDLNMQVFRAVKVSNFAFPLHKEISPSFPETIGQITRNDDASSKFENLFGTTHWYTNLFGRLNGAFQNKSTENTEIIATKSAIFSF